MRALPALSVATAVVLVGFVGWRARTAGDGYLRGSATSTGPAVEVAADLSADPDVVAASRALQEADAPPSPAQARALDTAVTKLDLLTERDPSNVEYLFYRGVAATMARDESGARAYLARVATASTLKERDARFVYLKALVILTFEAKKPDGALRLLRLLKSEAPGFLPEPVDRALHRALLQSAATRYEPGRNYEAVGMVEEAMDLVRDHPLRLAMTRRVLARTYTRAQRYHEAEEAWRALVEETDGKNVDVLSGLANVLSMQSRWDEAITHFTRAIALLEAGAIPVDPGAAEARMRRGNCYRLLGRLDEALADFERYVREHPDDHRGVHWLGMVWFDGFEDAAKARPYLEQAYLKAPWCDVYGSVLLQLYEVRLPDPAKAASLRREMATNADAHRKKVEDLANNTAEGVSICR